MLVAIMWTYSQSTGQLYQDGELVAVGYSGHGDGRNNSVMQERPNVGPIPRGRYLIGAPFDTTTHGPYVLRLTPDSGNQMFGRAGFLIHGDNQDHDASQGCIILQRVFREKIATSGDEDLEVVT